MFQRFTTDTFNWIFIIGVALLFAEIFFFNNGLIFGILFLSALIYIGKRMYENIVGKILFWIGVFILFFTIIDLMVARFIIIAAIVMFIISYRQSKDDPDYFSPELSEENVNSLPEPLVKVESIFVNQFSGNQSTDESPYKWRDINVHGGFGDRIIDLSNTVLPEEAVISIRQLVGNIKVYVPYEVEVHVTHSAVFGRSTVFHKKQVSLFNQTFSYMTENYGTGKPRVKIVTSLLSGDIEVKRI
ncbi:cell wall-active antibiotics response protein LiaF [Evansella tamaricis]|uniref:Cell wall-active antibiotics response protein n=1 Tax=Evansella tamaricis TaxID=2069301 RepID=A0ABS6JBE5_9BACI|nr:cell wall-active antibiotics response protein LiaF [Evansella tamaricis]MBU9711001.1 cell wall-active antibiotics response protein [Evansella tamaricis]